MASELIATVAPVARRVRAFFAPVNRTNETPTVWDPAGLASFSSNAPPAPWIDLGWCRGFTRKSGTKVGTLVGGAPGTVTGQVRTEVDATVSVQFESWSKLALALTSGVQQMNVLRTQTGAAANGSGGAAVAPVPLNADSTATTLDVGAAVSGFVVGEIVAVDVDYTGQTGFVGSAVSGGYVKSAALIGTDIDYVRRVTLNVGRIVAIGSGTTAGAVTLESPLLAGVPAAAMKVSGVVGFCDREGSSFFQEWSALFVGEGRQGERVLWFYPRLQTMSGIAEAESAASGGYETMRLSAAFRALPVKDPIDGETVVCFRSYVAG